MNTIALIYLIISALVVSYFCILYYKKKSLNYAPIFSLLAIAIIAIGLDILQFHSLNHRKSTPVIYMAFAKYNKSILTSIYNAPFFKIKANKSLEHITLIPCKYTLAEQNNCILTLKQAQLLNKKYTATICNSIHCIYLNIQPQRRTYIIKTFSNNYYIVPYDPTATSSARR